MSPKRMFLTIAPDGIGHCLYGELIDLRAIGTLACQRASHIEFDPATQEWHVLPPDRRQVLFSHHSRSACVEWEQTHLHSA